MDNVEIKAYMKEYIQKQQEILKEQIESLDSTTKNIAETMSLSKAAGVISEITKIQSPIERLFLLGIYGFEDEIELLIKSKRFYCINQQEVVCKNKTYRLDFLLAAIYKDELKLLAVECDGHDFHEKTKKQAAHDKQRERALTKLGYRIIRFSGSELYKDYIGCAKEALNILFDIEDIEKQGVWEVSSFKLPGVKEINYL